MSVFNKINDILLNSNKPSIELEKLFKEDEFIKSDFRIIGDLKNVPQDKKFHPEGNVWNHTKMVVDLAGRIKEYSENSKNFMWSSIFHDIGKVKTTRFIKGRYRSYNHDIEGEKITYKILKKYMNEEEAVNISEIVRFHMHHIYILKDLPFADIEKLIKSSNYNDIILLFICDKLGRGSKGIEEKIDTINEVEFILEKIERYEANINIEISKRLQKINDIVIK